MNLTGTKIKDTYPDVVTIGNNNTIENGTGSNIPFLNISASYSIITYVTSSTTSVSASYSESSSYAPNPFPDITDINQAIGINQTNPQYALDVNGKIGNSQYGNINNIQVDDGGGNIIISPAIGINLNSNLNGNNITVEDGSGNMGLVATSGLELYSNLNGNDINLEDGSGNISLTAANDFNFNGTDIKLNGTSIVGGGGSLTLPVILNDGGGNGTLNISSDGNSDYTIGQSQGGNIGFGIDGNVDLYDTAGSHISLDDSNNITLTAPTNIQLTSNLNGNNIQLEDGTGNMNLTAASGRINLNGATSIKTAEGDTFYAHTVAGNLVWTTSP